MANEIHSIHLLHAMVPEQGPRVAAPVAPPVAPAPAPSAPAQELQQDLERAVAEISQHLEAQTRTDLQFRMDRDAGRVVVSVVDARDGTVLRQLPSEVVLRIARHLDEYQAHLIEETA